MRVTTLAFIITTVAMVQGAVAQTTRPSRATTPQSPAAAEAAQATTRPVDLPEDDPVHSLGAPFISRAAGIAFQPPAGGVQSRRMGYGEEIVQYGNVDEKWSLKVSRIAFEKPARLLAPAKKKPNEEPGILDEAVHQLLIQNFNTEVMRKDVVNVGPYDAGLIISRFTQGGSYWLRQQAFIAASDRLYYVFDFMTPSSRTMNDKPEDEDPAELAGIRVFRAMLDTVELLDQSQIRADNELRLLQTRTFQMDLGKRVKECAVPDQYFRVMREGKDVGWVYIAEELGDFRGKSGVFVSTLTHGTPGEKMTVDVASDAFAMLDSTQADEWWMAMNTIDQGGSRSSVTEIGQGGKRTRRIMERGQGEEQSDPRQPRVREIERYSLNVTQTSRSGPRSTARDLPTYYVPQATASMLPRLLPKGKARSFLVAVWVSAEQEVMYRYLDVEPERDVLFNGQTVRAATVKDRIGLEGDATFHYIAPDGKYLGSVTPASGVVVVATDMQTIMRLWPNAKIQRPRLLEGAK